MAVELIAKLLWAAAGFAIIWLAAGLGVGGVDEPGPGMMSLGLGIVMVLIGLGGASKQILGAFSGKADPGSPQKMRPPEEASAELPSPPWSNAMVIRVGAVVVALAVYIFLFEKIGFLVLTFVLMTALLIAFAQLRWMWALTLAALLSISNYALFKLLLGTQLPAGILG
jgi:hypothetical protein